MYENKTFKSYRQILYCQSCEKPVSTDQRDRVINLKMFFVFHVIKHDSDFE